MKRKPHKITITKGFTTLIFFNEWIYDDYLNADFV